MREAARGSEGQKHVYEGKGIRGGNDRKGGIGSEEACVGV